MQIVEYGPHGVIADRVDLEDRHVSLAGDGLALLGRMTLDLGARAQDAQEFGREFEGLAGLERHPQRRLVLAQPYLGRPCRSIGCGWHRVLLGVAAAMQFRQTVGSGGVRNAAPRGYRPPRPPGASRAAPSRPPPSAPPSDYIPDY